MSASWEEDFYPEFAGTNGRALSPSPNGMTVSKMLPPRSEMGSHRPRITYVGGGPRPGSQTDPNPGMDRSSGGEVFDRVEYVTPQHAKGEKISDWAAGSRELEASDLGAPRWPMRRRGYAQRFQRPISRRGYAQRGRKLIRFPSRGQQAKLRANAIVERAIPGAAAGVVNQVCANIRASSRIAGNEALKHYRKGMPAHKAIRAGVRVVLRQALKGVKIPRRFTVPMAAPNGALVQRAQFVQG